MSGGAATEHLPVRIANERTDRLALVAPIVAGPEPDPDYEAKAARVLELKAAAMSSTSRPERSRRRVKAALELRLPEGRRD
jgi:hypothetical protein